MNTRRFHPRILRFVLLAFFWLTFGCGTWTIGAQIIRTSSAETQVGFYLQIELAREVWDALEGTNPFNSKEITDPWAQQGWVVTESEGGRVLTFTKSATPLEQLPAQRWTLEKSGGVTRAKLAVLAPDASNPDNTLLRDIEIIVDESGAAPRYEYTARVEVPPPENSSGSSGDFATDLAAAFAELGSTSTDDPQIKRLEEAIRRVGPPKLIISATLPGQISSATLNGAPNGTIEQNTVRWQAPLDRAGTYTVHAVSSLAAAPAATVALPTSPPAAPQVSDDFTRPDAGPCQLGLSNNTLGGDRQLFYLPIFPSGGTDPTNPIGANLVSGALQNNGLDYGGVQFALTDACAQPIGMVRGADMGQDLNLRADLLTPTDAAGHVSQAGPYVRNRAAAMGDGIIGGEAAGYWVQLESTGEVKLKRVNPSGVIATSCKPASFDTTVFHTLEIAAGGNQLQVALDGKLLTFTQNNELVIALLIPPTAGSNDGTAGIAFGAEANRGQIGGQRADNLAVTAYRSLDGLPVQNNCVSAPGVVATPTTDSGAPTITPRATQVAIAPTQAAPSTARTGDCNSDGKLTELDALCALQMSMYLVELNLVMDVDGNGQVDSRDAVIILQRAVGK
ncbi:MAG: hypothetical protein HY741_09700 [Chloroflexi bacterium]|nr:hypothetical protein [Chloroflexota bacterium]